MNFEGRTEMFKEDIYETFVCAMWDKIVFYIFIMLRENVVSMSCRIGFIFGKMQWIAEHGLSVVVGKN